jgi:uncharacterized protein (DUF302 family)
MTTTTTSTSDLRMITSVDGPFETAINATREALAAQGFGILSEIDVSAALKKRLGVDHPRTVILGACSPPFAHQALLACPDISVLLPCNVVVRESTADGATGRIEVVAINPVSMGQLIPQPEIIEIAQQVGAKLSAALAALNP